MSLRSVESRESALAGGALAEVTEMERMHWLVMIGADSVVLGVDGGAPEVWIGCRIDACAELPEEVREAAHGVVADLRRPARSGAVRHVRVQPVGGGPSFTLVAAEAILLQPAEAELEALLERLLDPIRRQAEELGVTVQLERSRDFPERVLLDAGKVGWAVTTLVGNALRYVRRGGPFEPGGNVTVRLTSSAPQGLVSVTVEDDGPGIPEGLVPWLFEAHPDTGRPAGVALRMVQEVMAAHGGGVIVKSARELDRRGTAITLCFPVRRGLSHASKG